jgi:hypothetical protein
VSQGTGGQWRIHVSAIQCLDMTYAELIRNVSNTQINHYVRIVCESYQDYPVVSMSDGERVLELCLDTITVRPKGHHDQS